MTIVYDANSKSIWSEDNLTVGQRVLANTPAARDLTVIITDKKTHDNGINVYQFNIDNPMTAWMV